MTASTDTATNADTTTPDLTADANLLQDLQPTAADVALQEWCRNKAGIALSPSVLICTTGQSVAGRGVFALEDVAKEDIIALIPAEVVFSVDNCRNQFMGTEMEMEIELDEEVSKTKRKRGRKRRWLRNLVSKLTRTKYTRTTRLDDSDEASTDISSEITDQSTMWAPMLTRYALEAIASSHPWAEWINQWNRCDPMHEAYLEMDSILRVAGAGSNKGQQSLPEYDMMFEELMCRTAKKIKDMMPHLNEKHLQAAVSIRLSRLEEHFRVLGFVKKEVDLKEALELYSIITSRAIELDGDSGVTAVLPFFDLLNHNLNPNLSLEFIENDEPEGFGSRGFYCLKARQGIQAGDELFVRYTNLSEKMDENAALWAAINWGIPHSIGDYEAAEK